MTLEKASVYSFNIFLLTFPFSVTISQSFAVFSILLFFANAIHKKILIRRLNNPFFISGIYLYLSMIIAIIANLGNYTISSFFEIFYKSEISDFWMCFIILPAYSFSTNAEYMHKIKQTILTSGALLVISGIASIFLPFRLATFVKDGFQIIPEHRMQHFAGTFMGFNTYLPIGFMNTHLTFGGLCGLIFPGVALRFIIRLTDRKLILNIIYTIFLIGFCIVILFNQSRSVWFGILFVFTLLSFKIKWNLFRNISWRLIAGIAILLCLMGIGSFYIFQNNWLIQRAVVESLDDNTTENQRYFIYKNSLSLMARNPIFGVGPGNFKKRHWEESEKMISKNEQLLYELSITPRGHAHHDLMHFYAIGGIIAFLYLLLLWFFLINVFIDNPLDEISSLSIGIFSLFIGGFFQCYLLDDEVALPFFSLVGVYAGSLKSFNESKLFKDILMRKLKQKKSSEVDTFSVELISAGNIIEYIFGFIKFLVGDFHLERYKLKIKVLSTVILGVPLITSIIYIAFKVRMEPMEVYKRKILTIHEEDRKIIRASLNGKNEKLQFPVSHAKDGFQVEGCLSHRYGNEFKLRTEDYSIKALIPESSMNYPVSVRVEAYSRDSFDQDQLYKVHKLSLIKEFKFLLNKGENLLKFDGLNTGLSEIGKFPDNVYFRDFKFFYSGFDSSQKYFELPHLDFGRLCDAGH